jgi:cytochrome c nitrite reductase small subunit
MKAGHAAGLFAVLLLAAALGVGAYTFTYAKGWSYVTNDAAACANCHVMREQYEGWTKSSHRSVAVCNDCHVPDGLVGKYYTKARNGFWHSYYFTTGAFEEPIRATALSREIAEANCRRCHGAVVSAMGTPAHAGVREISCVRCHGSVGHLELFSTNVAREERHD